MFHFLSETPVVNYLSCSIGIFAEHLLASLPVRTCDSLFLLSSSLHCFPYPRRCSSDQSILTDSLKYAGDSLLYRGSQEEREVKCEWEGYRYSLPPASELPAYKARAALKRPLQRRECPQCSYELELLYSSLPSLKAVWLNFTTMVAYRHVSEGTWYCLQAEIVR